MDDAIFSKQGQTASDKAALALVERAVIAMGGEEALSKLRTIEIHGHEDVWEHEYSFSAMPNAEEREGSMAEFIVRRDLEANAARIDWNRDIVRLKFRPYPTLYKFSETLTGSTGYVDGVDSSTPTALAKMVDPPGSPMSSVRFITTWRELTRESPRLLLEAFQTPIAVTPLDEVTVDDASFPAVAINVPVVGTQTEISDWQFIALFEPDTGLPVRIRTMDGDPIQGTTVFDMELSDWREIDGIRIPFKRVHTHNGRKLIETTYQEVELNPTLPDDCFEMPVSAYAATARANTTEAFTNIPYQWTLRRIKWGGDLNSDAVAWDATARPEPKWVTIRPGVDWTEGVTHNSVMVVMKDFLIIWEASLHENFSEWMIRSAKRRYPDKPIRYLILSHHHMDHNGGARPFGAEGSTVVVPTGPGYEKYFDRLFDPESPYLNDRLHRNPKPVKRITVDETYTIDDGEREFRLYNIKDSDHAPSLLIGYIPDAGLLVNTDLWNTNEKLGDEPGSRHVTLLNAVDRWGVKPEHSVSGHGPMVPYQNLAGLRRA